MLITGAARRVGAAIALALHASGARIALHTRQSVLDAENGRNVFSTGNGRDSALFRSYIAGLARLLPSAAGRLMEAELKALEAALGNPEHPVAAVVGGAKVSSKLDVLNNLVTKVDHLIIGGGMAGLAGSLEFTGALGAINLGFPSGYGFTAIIVAFLGRLSPIGCLIAGIVLAVTYVGGQVAQTTVHIPNSTAGIFQAMMLFFILASDILIRYRVRVIATAPKIVAGE